MDAESRKDQGDPHTEALREHGAGGRGEPRADHRGEPDAEPRRASSTEDLREPPAEDGEEPPTERHQEPSAEHLQQPPAEDPGKPPAAHLQEPGAGDRREPSAQARWERRTEVPLAVASLLFLAAYATRVLAHGLTDGWKDLCLAVTLAAWALFAVDYVVRWRLSGQRLRFVRTHWLDTVVLVLPLLRPLRVVKVYEAVQRRHGRPRLALHARVIFYAGLSTVLLGFAGALAVYQQERGAPGASMRTFGDAVWWTSATLATVGYGDVSPVTARGRLIAVGIMAVGLALLGAVTGTFASWLLQVFAREDDERPPGS